jgi:ribosomal protein S8
LTLKSIFNFTKRSEKFFNDYKDILKINYVNEFIDLGCINLMNRLWKEFKHHKLFEDKFYLVANILHLNISIFNKSNHFKLSKANQVKYINEILNFLYREGYVDYFSRNKDDPDVASTIEAFTIFSKNNKSFVNESQRFSAFLRSITRSTTEYILPISPFKKSNPVGPRRILSHNNVVTLNSTNIGVAKPIPSLFSRFEKRDSAKSIKENLEKEKEILLKDEISVIKEDPKEFSISHNPDYSRKLSDIERKLTKLEDKITSNTNVFTTATKKPFYVEFQRTPCTEFNIISPVKEKQNESCTEYKLTMHELDNCLYVNGKSSYTSVSDPFDEDGVLSLIDQSVMCNNMERAKSIILWRKRILEISKNNGWVVGKILAFNTIRKLEINDQDIIEANLLFMEKYNLIDKHVRESFNLDIDFKSLLKEYEKELKESVKNLSNLNFNE